MLTYATAEPLYHWAKNPSTIKGLTEGSTAGNVRDAYIWSFTIGASPLGQPMPLWA
jgi:hypothetical protein